MEQISAYILAGGKSSRMGTDKGLISFKGKAMVEHVIKALQPVIKNIIIIANNKEYKKFGLPVIEDDVKEKGPAGGIYTALKHSNTQLNFIVSCDTPFVTSHAVKAMIENYNQEEIMIPIRNNHLEPLFGIYSKLCLPKWKQLLDGGMIKLQELITQFDYKLVDVNKHIHFGENIFININTRSDFETIKKV